MDLQSDPVVLFLWGLLIWNPMRANELQTTWKEIRKQFTHSFRYQADLAADVQVAMKANGYNKWIHQIQVLNNST